MSDKCEEPALITIEEMVRLKEELAPFLKMSVQHLLLFAALNLLKSESKASELMLGGKQQSLFSRTIDSLESKLGKRLTEKLRVSTGRGRVRISMEGEKLNDLAIDVINVLKKHAGSWPKENGRPVIVGVTTFLINLALEFLDYHDRRFFETTPKWELRHIRSGKILEEVRNGSIDCAFGGVTFLNGEPAFSLGGDITCHQITDDAFGILANYPGIPDPVTLDWMADNKAQMILPKQGIILDVLCAYFNIEDANKEDAISKILNTREWCEDVHFVLALLEKRAALGSVEGARRCMITTKQIHDALDLNSSGETSGPRAKIYFSRISDLPYTVGVGLFRRNDILESCHHHEIKNIEKHKIVRFFQAFDEWNAARRSSSDRTTEKV